MTCVINETVVLNTKYNKQLFENNEVIALKADKGIIPDAVEEILKELGNPSQAIPYYAIYGPALPEPITLEGPITFGQVEKAIVNAKGRSEETTLAAESVTSFSR